MEKLTRYAINRLKGLMAKEIKLIRVYPYESRSNDVLAATSYSKVKIQKNSLLYKRMLDIRRIAEKHNLSDNKIVIQVEVNCGGYYGMVFLGYWDDNSTQLECLLFHVYMLRENFRVTTDG